MLLLLVLIYRQVQQKGNLMQQWDELLLHWEKGDKFFLLVIALLAPINWLLESVKWKLLLRKIEPVSLKKAFASTLTGIAVSLVTPNKLGDFAGRILYLDNKNKLRAAIAVLVSNLSQTIVTCFFGIAGIIYFYILYPGSWQLIMLIVAVFSTLLLVFIYLRIDLVAQWAEKRKWLKKVIISIRVLRRYSRKDLLLLLIISFLRFCVYNMQFLVLANILGAGLPWVSGFFISGLMFWMIMVIPSIFLADLGVRGYVAGLLFTDTGMAANSMAILAGSYTIWLLNLALPAIIGSVLIITIRLTRD